MKIVSVKCASPDAHLHLAPFEDGVGTEVHTLCLVRWAREEPARTDSIWCAECIARFAAKLTEQERNNG